MFAKIALWIITAFATIFAVLWLGDNAGSVKVVWLGYVMETSVAFCIFCVVAFMVAIYLLLLPARWLKWIESRLHNRRDKKSEALLIAILTNVLCKNTEHNKKLIEQFAKIQPNARSLILMLKALSEQEGDFYAELIRNKTTQQAGWQGVITEHVKRGELILASEEVEKLLKENPKETWVLKEALCLLALSKQWQKALTCLDGLYKNKALDKGTYLYQKATLLVEMNKGAEAFDICPALPQAALLAAKQKPAKAQKIFLKSWKSAPSFAVYRAYLALFAKENSLAQFKRTEKLCAENPTAKLNALVLADAAITARLWSEARKELEAYLAQYPLTSDIACQMAIIEMETSHNLSKAIQWIQKTDSIEANSDYICAKCGKKTNEWAALCPVCNGFAELKVK